MFLAYWESSFYSLPRNLNMPLLDRFHPPLSIERRWESFDFTWATLIAYAPHADKIISTNPAKNQRLKPSMVKHPVATHGLRK